MLECMCVLVCIEDGWIVVVIYYLLYVLCMCGVDFCEYVYCMLVDVLCIVLWFVCEWCYGGVCLLYGDVG